MTLDRIGEYIAACSICRCRGTENCCCIYTLMYLERGWGLLCLCGLCVASPKEFVPRPLRPFQAAVWIQSPAQLYPRPAAGAETANLGQTYLRLLACQTLSRLFTPGLAWGWSHINPAASVSCARASFNLSTTSSQPTHCTNCPALPP